MIKLRLLLPALLLIIPLVLVACGSGDESDGGESDEDQIVTVIETLATSDDPTDCEALARQTFLEQTQLSEGAEATADCEEAAKDEENGVKSIAVSKVEVADSTATAEVAFTGGTFDGQALSVSLVEEDGDWKLDEVVKFAEFNQKRLIAGFEDVVRSSKPGSGLPALEPREVHCFGEAIGALSKEETEEVLFGGSLDRLVLFAEGCE